MRFSVVASGGDVLRHSQPHPSVVLRVDSWDDYRYRTSYRMTYFALDGTRHAIGTVKIGQEGLTTHAHSVDLPSFFERLPRDCFSLGQDTDYYENLNRLGLQIRQEILQALRDIALDPEIRQEALKHEVTGISLMRFVSLATIQGQLNRLANGGLRLTQYSFSYRAPRVRGVDPVSLSFEVVPESKPPTNVHVLIGRNGVGKTRLLQYMSRSVVEGNSDMVGEFDTDASTDRAFANLVSVSFSAFDEFEPLSEKRDQTKVGIPFSYVGLKWKSLGADGKPRAPKSPGELSTEFVDSVRNCRIDPRRRRWMRAIETLESDPIFEAAEVRTLAEGDEEAWDIVKLEASRMFKDLSSGHKIVLLTITRLVELVQERSLVLLDEPEAHLHPPLLSAFVRALSDLLIDRNGVAVIATHSPVVLQEVPASCVWKIRRTGTHVSIDRPETETFGENAGILTREAFGLEVTDSGFHKLLQEAVSSHGTYEQVLNEFGGQLGAEARALVRAMVEARKQSLLRN